jgi:hypothetical protein
MDSSHNIVCVTTFAYLRILRHVRLIFLLGFFILFASEVYAQRSFLMLQKRARNKTVRYEVGEELIFYRNGSRSKIKGEIIGFQDSVIEFKGYKVHVNEITALHIDENTRWWIRYKYAQLLLLGGTGYLAVDAINNGEVSKETLIISGSMIGMGLIFKALIPNKIKIKGRTRLRIVHL